ncbi:MAG: hypothetical protein RL095_2899 [Verrucomicrobiota bacterium]|jgi:putative endonuclease
MAAAHLATGSYGERLAVRELRDAGLEILARNYRIEGLGEIDIVALDGCVLCFVEVKTRQLSERSRPGDAIDDEKRRRVSRTARHWLARAGIPAALIRFDTVEVRLGNRFWRHQVLHTPASWQQHAIAKPG